MSSKIICSFLNYKKQVRNKGLMCEKCQNMAQSSHNLSLKLKLQVYKNIFNSNEACIFKGQKTSILLLIMLYARNLDKGDLDEEEAEYFKNILENNKKELD